MTRATARVFLFGDQTTAFETDLRQLLHVRDNATLTSFLTKANAALRDEIAKLPAAKREPFPRFTDLLDLVNGYQETQSHPALALALLCLNQLGRFIKYDSVHYHCH